VEVPGREVEAAVRDSFWFASAERCVHFFLLLHEDAQAWWRMCALEHTDIRRARKVHELYETKRAYGRLNETLIEITKCTQAGVSDATLLWRRAEGAPPTLLDESASSTAQRLRKGATICLFGINT
jgi:hypothetical protein